MIQIFGLKIANNRRFAIILKSIPIIFIVTFVWLHITLNYNDINSEKESNLSHKLLKSQKQVINGIHLNNTISDNSLIYKPLDEIKKSIEIINENEIIFNKDIYNT